MSTSSSREAARAGKREALVDDDEVDELDQFGAAFDAAAASRAQPPKKRVKFAAQDDVKELDFREEPRQVEDAAAGFEPFHMERERAEGWFEQYGSGRAAGASDDDDDDDADEAWLKEHDEKAAAATSATAATAASAFLRRIKRVKAVRQVQTCDPVQLRQVLLQHMEAGESVLRALRRLGKRDEHGCVRPSSRAALDLVTEAADALLASGHYDVYQDTKEVLQRFVSSGGATRKRARPCDLEHETARGSGSGGGSGGSDTQWQFKWSKDADEVHGPFSSAHMKQWKQQGYFVGDAAAYIRRVSPAAPDSWTLSSESTVFD